MIIFDLIVLVILIEEKIDGLRQGVGIGYDGKLAFEGAAYVLCDDLYVGEADQDQEKDEAKKENDYIEVGHSKVVVDSGQAIIYGGLKRVVDLAKVAADYLVGCDPAVVALASYENFYRFSSGHCVGFFFGLHFE